MVTACARSLALSLESMLEMWFLTVVSSMESLSPIAFAGLHAFVGPVRDGWNGRDSPVGNIIHLLQTEAKDPQLGGEPEIAFAIIQDAGDFGGQAVPRRILAHFTILGAGRTNATRMSASCQ